MTKFVKKLASAATKQKTKQELLPPEKEDRRKNLPQLFKPGQSGNPLGRQRGSRNKFADAFLKDFLAAWEIHGATAIEECVKEDPATFLRVAASILPKDININPNESTVEKILDQFRTAEELREFLAGIRAIGARTNGVAEVIAAPTRGQPNRVH